MDSDTTVCSTLYHCVLSSKTLVGLNLEEGQAGADLPLPSVFSSDGSRTVLNSDGERCGTYPLMAQIFL